MALLENEIKKTASYFRNALHHNTPVNNKISKYTKMDVTRSHKLEAPHEHLIVSRYDICLKTKNWNTGHSESEKL